MFKIDETHYYVPQIEPRDKYGSYKIFTTSVPYVEITREEANFKHHELWIKGFKQYIKKRAFDKELEIMLEEGCLPKEVT